jgi:hypothetical protein
MPHGALGRRVELKLSFQRFLLLVGFGLAFFDVSEVVGIESLQVGVYVAELLAGIGRRVERLLGSSLDY